MGVVCSACTNREAGRCCTERDAGGPEYDSTWAKSPDADGLDPSTVQDIILIGVTLHRLEDKMRELGGTPEGLAISKMKRALTELESCVVASQSKSPTMATRSAPELGQEEAEPSRDDSRFSTQSTGGLKRLARIQDPAISKSDSPLIEAMRQDPEMFLSAGMMGPALVGLVARFWPRIEKFVTRKLGTVVGRFSGLSLDKVDLGNNLPELGPFYVTDRNHSDAISIHVGITLPLEMDIRLHYLGIPISVTALRLKSEIRIVLTPHIEQCPFFGGIQIYFPNSPDIDISFAGAGRMAQAPGLRGKIRDVLTRLLNPYTLPRRIAIDIDPSSMVDKVDLGFPEPYRIVRVTLWSGHDLIGVDTNLSGEVTSDPYVVATLGITSWTSPTIFKTLNPSWGDGMGLTVDFPVHDECQTISFKVFDDAYWTSHDLIGQSGPLSVSELLEAGKLGRIDLKKANRKPGAGSLSISVSVHELVTTRPSEPSAGPSEAHLNVKVLTVQGLPPDAAYPFVVRLQIKGETEVYAEACTEESQPPYQREMAASVRKIAANMVGRGHSAEDISGALCCSIKEARAFIEHLERNANAELEMSLHASNPRFDQKLQLLLPSGSVSDTTKMVFTVVDNNQQILGTKDLPMKELLDNELALTGPFFTDGGQGQLEIIGALRLRWLSV